MTKPIYDTHIQAPWKNKPPKWFKTLAQQTITQWKNNQYTTCPHRQRAIHAPNPNTTVLDPQNKTAKCPICVIDHLATHKQRITHNHPCDPCQTQHNQQTPSYWSTWANQTKHLRILTRLCTQCATTNSPKGRRALMRAGAESA